MSRHHSSRIAARTAPKDYFEVSLLEAARAVVWKLSHNFDLPDYKGPARIDRRDATIRQLMEAIEREEAKSAPSK